MDRRQALKLFGALGVAGFATACGSNSDEDSATTNRSRVRIGLLVPQTGPNKPIGDELAHGLQLYLSLKDGQLGGHPVDLITADEGDNARSAKAGLDKLLSQNVLAVTGVASSTGMLAVRDGIRDARVPLIGSNASPSSLQGEVYIWRTSYVEDEPGRALGPYVARTERNQKVAIVAPDYDTGKDVVQGFREGFGRADSRISDPVIWTRPSAQPSETYFAGVVNTLKQRNPGVIFCFFYGDAGVAFVQQVRQAGLNQKIYAPGFLTEGTALEQMAENARGIVTAANYSADLNNSANRVFSAAYRKTYGITPTTYAVASYDAAQVLDKAIALAGASPAAQQINLMLGKVGQIDSPRGAWQFNQPRTPQQTWYLREVRRDGQVLSNVAISELVTLG